MKKEMKRDLRVLLSVALVILLSITLPTPLSAQKEEYVLRTSMDPPYEPPPAGSLNIFSPKCILGTAPGMSWTSGFVIERLAKYWALNSTYEPWLAESWETTSDGFLVHLRRGVTWSDGTPFTAKDVVSTFYCLYLTRNIIWQYVDSVEAVDDYTVLFKSDNPGNPILWYYALTSAIVPYKQYGEFSDEAIVAHDAENETMLNDLLVKLQEYKPSELIGTGAYEIESISRSDIILRKREDYWGLRLGFTKGIYFDKISLMNHPPDPQIAQMELSDQCDIEYHGGAVKGQVYAAPQYVNCTFAAYPSPSGTCTFFNLRRYPFSLKEFRQAIAYAVNLSKAVLSVYPVYVETPENKHTGFPPATMMTYLTEETWQSLKSYEYDPEKAEEILTSLGFKRGSDGVWVTPNGTRCEFEMIIHSGWGSGRVNTYLAQQLTEFGIKVNVKAIDPATIGDFLKRGEFDISSQYWGGILPYFAAAVWTYNWLPSTIVVGPGPGFPSTYELNGELIDVTELTSKMNLVDEETRKEIINTLAQIFNEYLPFLPHYVRPGGPLFINFEHIDWPLPYRKGEYRFPTPIIKGEDCAGWTYPFDQSLPWIVIKGMAKPKGLVIEKPAVTLVTVFAAAEIPRFVGVDGENYGPYSKGEAMVIPKEDAERLISEGKASYTSPIISETIPAMMNKIMSIEDSIEDLKSSIDTLTDQVSTLSSQQSTLTMAAVIEAIIIVILAIGLMRRGGS